MIRFLAAHLILVSLLCMAEEPALERIAFGSCAKQQLDQPIWDSIVAARPDLFIFGGDNIYGDTLDMEELQERWSQLAAKPGYQMLKATCPILATWDDHDYGWNDAGAEYKMKKESQQIFLDFFDEPKDSPRRQQEGIYASRIIGPEGRRVQIILLDTRYHRSPLVKRRDRPWEPGEGVHGLFLPNNDPKVTILGDAQWKWLEEQLRLPAEIRILVSSIQVLSNEHWYEKWGNFPHERTRLLKLLKDTGASNLFILSGDRHTAEISMSTELGFPLYDITSSGLNQVHRWRSELNPYRIGGMFYEQNFGMIEIDWNQKRPMVRLQVRDLDGKVVIQAKQAF